MLADEKRMGSSRLLRLGPGEDPWMRPDQQVLARYDGIKDGRLDKGSSKPLDMGVYPRVPSAVVVLAKIVHSGGYSIWDHALIKTQPRDLA